MFVCYCCGKPSCKIMHLGPISPLLLHNTSWILPSRGYFYMLGQLKTHLGTSQIAYSWFSCSSFYFSWDALLLFPSKSNMLLHPSIRHCDFFLGSGTNAAELHLWGFSYPIKTGHVEFWGGKCTGKRSGLGRDVLLSYLCLWCLLFVLRAVSFSFETFPR